MSVGASPLWQLAGDFTVDTWIRTRATSTQNVLGAFLNGGTQWQFAINFANSLGGASVGALRFLYASSGQFAEVYVPRANIFDGQFHHIAARRGGSTLDLFINGVRVDTKPITLTITANMPLELGRNSVPMFSFIGELDEVEIFHQALSNDEIQAIYNAGSAGKCKPMCAPPPPEMVAWWLLDETTGRMVTDIKGGHNGTTAPGAIGTFPFRQNSGPATGSSVASLTPSAVVGRSLYFVDQKRRFVRVPSAASLDIGSGDFSIDAWVNVAGRGPSMIAEKYNLGTETGYSFYIEKPSPPMGLLNFVLHNGIAIQPYSQPVPLTSGWHHVAVTFARGPISDLIKFYLDGSAVGLLNPPSIGSAVISNTSDFLIGGTTFLASAPGEIAIDELEVFQRALMQIEIETIYKAGTLGKCRQF